MAVLPRRPYAVPQNSQLTRVSISCDNLNFRVLSVDIRLTHSELRYSQGNLTI